MKQFENKNTFIGIGSADDHKKITAASTKEEVMNVMRRIPAFGVQIKKPNAVQMVKYNAHKIM